MPTYHQKLQLLYMGLLQTSQIQFYYIMEIMIEKEEGTYKMETNLFREYEQLINKQRLVLNGGNFGRVQCPSLHNYHSLLPQSKRNSKMKNEVEQIEEEFDIDTSQFLKRLESKRRKKEYLDLLDSEIEQIDPVVALDNNLNRLKIALKGLEDGDFLDDDGILQFGLGSKKFDINGIGHVAGISFPSIAIFCGLCSPTKLAVKTAKQSLINTTTSNSYFAELQKFCKNHNHKKKVNLEQDSPFYRRSMTFIGTSWGEVSSSIENCVCASFRKKQKYDCFFYGQDMYNLQCSNDNVWVKKFGCTTWTILHEGIN